MDIRIEVRIFETDSMIENEACDDCRSPVFGPKILNAETFNTIVYQTAPLAKLPPDGLWFIREI